MEASSQQPQVSNLLDEQSVTDSKASDDRRQEDESSSEPTQTIQACIREEREIRDWLDEQILEYRVRLGDNKQSSSSNNNEDKEVETGSLRNRLQQETTRLRLEHALLSNLALAPTAVATSFPDPNHDNEEDKDALFLRQQAMSARDSQVKKVLESKRILDELREQAQQATAKCQQLIEENEQLERQNEKASPSPHESSHDNCSPEQSRLEQENAILKRVLQDLVAASELDWYADERLCNIMTGGSE